MEMSFKRRFAFGGSLFSSPLDAKHKTEALLVEQMGKAEMLSIKTHFNSQEILSLFLMHQRLVSQGIPPQSGGGKMDRLRFREVLHTTFDLTDDLMLDRIFRAFDANNDSIIDEVEWVTGLSVLVKGTLEEQISFCYFIYDINGDRALAREELTHCLKNSLIRSVAGGDEDIEESVKEIVEMAMKKLDVDRNGQITFSDFEAAVEADPFLLEAIGHCLPSPEVTRNFLKSFPQEYSISPTQWKKLTSSFPKSTQEDWKRRSSNSSTVMTRTWIRRRTSSVGTSGTAPARVSSTPPSRKLTFGTESESARFPIPDN